MVDVHFAQFGAAVQRWVDLARVQKMSWIEGAFDALLMFHIVFGEHLTHEVAFFHPDPMFAGEHAAHLHTEPEDVGAEFLRRLQLSRLR